MSFSTILFTEKGRALQAKAQSGTTLTFTKIAMGSGSLSGQNQITLNNLIDSKVNISISEIKRNLNYATIKGIFNNSDIITGFYWREIGIFANDPDLGEILYCYGNAGALAEYIPPSSSEIMEKVVSVSVIIGDATTVTASINQSLVYASIEDLDSLRNDLSIFQTAGGTSTNIILTDIDFVDGKSKTYIVTNNNNGSNTSINGKALYKPGTTSAPKLVAGKAVTIWYNAAGDCFFIKASAEGDVVAANVLASKTFSNDDDTGIVGTMPNNGPAEAETVNLTSEGQEYVISSGYHSGLRKIKAAITGLIASVIKAGTTVGGILGTFTSDATAGDSDVLNGKTYYRNGVKGTGSIISKATQTYTPTTSDQNIASGQYLSGTQTIKGDANLLSANIKSGISIFGVSGNSNVVDTSAGDAIAAEILNGKKAYVDGALITGTIPSKATATITPGTTDQTIAAGQYLSGAQTISGDADLIAANIKSGINIFGVLGSLIPGLQYASGTVTSSSEIQVYCSSDGSTDYGAQIVVSGLTFKPDMIIAWKDGNTYQQQVDMVAKYLANRQTPGYETVMTSNGAGGRVLYNDMDYAIGGSPNPLYVNATGFKIISNQGTGTYKYIAIAFGGLY